MSFALTDRNPFEKVSSHCSKIIFFFFVKILINCILSNRVLEKSGFFPTQKAMSTFYGMEKSAIEWVMDAPPRYSQIDEGTPLLAKKCEANFKHVLGMRRSSLLLILYIIFYVVYLVTGGLVFAVLEAPEEEDLRLSVLKMKEDFLSAHLCVTGRTVWIYNKLNYEIKKIKLPLI